LIAATKRDERTLRSGAGRESASASENRKKEKTAEGEAEEDADEEGVAADVNLREAQRILIDYVQLSRGQKGLAGAPKTVDPKSN